MHSKQGKFIMFLMAIVLLASFGAVVFHHHNHFQDQDDCSLCHLVKQVTGLLLFAAFLIGQIFSAKQFEFPAAPAFQSLDLISCLKNRAPPVLA